MKINKILAACMACSSIGAAFQATAQSDAVKPSYEIPGNETAKDRDGPRGVQLQDGVNLFPYANLYFGHDDNLLLTNTNQTASNFYILSPGLRLVARSESVQLGVNYDAKLGRYTSSSADNYNDQGINGTAEFAFGGKAGLRLKALYEQAHDPRGSTDRGISSRPDEYYNTGPSALFAYGGNGAIGRFEVEAGSYKKRYTNNRITTFASDRDTDAYAGRFFYRIAPKTSLLIEAREDRLDYLSSASLLNSNERRYLVGATWEATAATSGTVKFGQIRKNFTSNARQDYSGTGWEANVQWAPLTYSKFDLFTSKSFAESTGLGDFILTKRYGAAWKHEWDSRFNSAVSYFRADDAFSGNARSDSTDSMSFKLSYRPMRWLTVGGEYVYTNRDSNQSIYHYKKNLYMFTLGATL